MAHGYDRSGRVALPLPRAAVISTRLRVRHGVADAPTRVDRTHPLERPTWLALGLGLGQS